PPLAPRHFVRVNRHRPAREPYSLKASKFYTPCAVRPRPSQRSSRPLERREKCGQIRLLLRCQRHLEALVVEVDHLRQIRSRAVVEVGSTGGEPTQDRSLDAIEVTAFTGDQRPAGIARVERGGACRIGRIRTAADQI